MPTSAWGFTQYLTCMVAPSLRSHDWTIRLISQLHSLHYEGVQFCLHTPYTLVCGALAQRQLLSLALLYPANNQIMQRICRT